MAHTATVISVSRDHRQGVMQRVVCMLFPQPSIQYEIILLGDGHKWVRMTSRRLGLLFGCTRRRLERVTYLSRTLSLTV